MLAEVSSYLNHIYLRCPAITTDSYERDVVKVGGRHFSESHVQETLSITFALGIALENLDLTTLKGRKPTTSQNVGIAILHRDLATMGRVIRNQRKGRGSIFSEFYMSRRFRLDCKAHFRPLQPLILDSTKPPLNSGLSTMPNVMATLEVLSKI